ncbi:MAG TPA: VOC family protein [Syntrophomonadaceae bacterium]|nr:VOC family protein [Syntrophomonadaceae bacterium]
MYKLAHTGIVVGDCERSAQFYKQVLGCEYIEDFENDSTRIIFLRLENGILELIQHKDVAAEYRQAGPIDHLALAVKNIDTEVLRLKKLGIPCLFEEPKEVLKGKRIMFFSGPDGERLEFIEEEH